MNRVMMMSFSNSGREFSSINNLKIIKSLSLMRRNLSMRGVVLIKRKTVGSGKRCRRLTKRGNSKLRKSSRGPLTYST